MGIKSDAKTVIDSHKIPNKPKRPLTGYLKFMLEKRPIILKENPSLQNTDIVKRVAEQWKDLSLEGKAKYQEAAVQDRAKYDEEILKYNADLTPEQVEVLSHIEYEKRKDRKKRKLRKEYIAAGKPKRPINSFGLFVQDNATPGKSLTEVMIDVKAKWEQLPDIEKQKYQIKFRKSLEKYEVELAKWENEMIAEGKTHLIRAQTLKKHPSLTSKGKKSNPE